MPIGLQLALAVGISCSLYIAALLFAPVATPFMLLVPLPGLILALRTAATWCGLWFSLIASAIALALGPDAAAGFVLPFGVPALVVAVGTRRLWSFERTVIGGVVAWSLGIGCLLVLAYGNVVAIVATARQQLLHSVDLAWSTYGSFAAPDNASVFGEIDREAVVSGVLEILPALIVLSGALTIIVNLVLLRAWSRSAHDVNLRLWRTPDALIWVLIASGFGMFVPVPALALVARNLFIIVLGCYFCQGLAIVSYYLERFRLPRGIRIAGYVLIAVQHVVAAMVLALGVFDLWGNFRRSSAGPADVSFPTDGE